MTASELIELLEDLDPDTEIRLAHQPSWPFEYSLSGHVAVSEGNPIAWLGEGEQLAYLPTEATEQLGWLRT